ncbi:MAG: TonB-dependent receptor plug domain-containing protein [Candidatus Acidiferrales bacterium]
MATGLAGAQEATQEQRWRELTKMSLEELANLEVTTASKKAEKRSEVPAAIYVVTQEDIRRSGATTLADLLRLAPGVQVAQQDSNKWAIGMGGFTSRLARSQLVLMDGRNVYTPLFAGVYWEVQDTLLEDIDRIEIIRGPGGSLWGANAVNGIVNVITKEAKGTQGSLLSAGGGVVEQGFTSFRYGGKRGENLHYRLYGKLFSRAPGFHANGDNFDDWRMGQTGLRMDWAHGERDRFSLQGDFYRGETGQRSAITVLSPPSSMAVEGNAHLSGGNVLAHWERPLGSGAALSLQSYYDHTHRQELTFRENRDTFELDFQHNFPLRARNGINWGLGYRVTSGDFQGVAPTLAFLPPRRTDQLVTGFFQDEIALVEGRLRLTVGSKFEHNGYSGAEVQPSLRLLWLVGARQKIWTAVSRAVRVPSRIEDDILITALLNPAVPAFARFLGNRQFESEKLIAYEAGYRAEATARLYIDLATFYQDYDDLLSIEPGTPFLESSPGPPHLVLPFSFRNRMTAETAGLTVAPEWRPTSRWRLAGAYTYLSLNLRKKAGSLDTSTEPSAEGSSPHHQVSLRSFLDLPHHLELDTLFRYVGALPSQKVASYPSADLRLGWRPTEYLEFSLVGQNLLQPHHPEFGGGTQVRRGAYGKMTWRW